MYVSSKIFIQIILLILRIVLAILGIIVGYDVLLLPYVLSDEFGIYKSFFPIIGYNKRTDNDESFWFRFSLFMSILSFSILAIFFKDYTIEILLYIFDLILSMRDWGLNKLTEMHSGGNQLSYKTRNDEYIRGMGDI